MTTIFDQPFGLCQHELKEERINNPVKTGVSKAVMSQSFFG
jgi:hypothetical protein